MTARQKLTAKDMEQDAMLQKLSEGHLLIQESLKKIHTNQQEHAEKQDKDADEFREIIGEIHRGMWGDEKNGHPGVVQRSLDNRSILKKHDMLFKKGIWWFGGLFFALELIGMTVAYFIFDK